MIPKVQFLILDYNRPNESSTLLTSLMCQVKIPREDYWITYLSNGGDNTQALNWYNEGYIDQLIVRKNNLGGSWGMRDLVSLCQSEYAFLIQNDQYLIREITENDLFTWAGNLYHFVKCIDLAGNQCQGKFSDRASFVKVKDYLEWVKDLPNYGPGYEGGKHNEGYIQDKFSENDWKIQHEFYFADNGRDSVREYPCGGITLWRTDTKELSILKPLHQKYDHLNLTDKEWCTILTNQWVNKTIPENWKANSFKFFAD